VDRDKPPTMPVPEAGRKYFNLGRNASYAAAARGEIPTIKIGGRIFAAVSALERMIEQADQIKSATKPKTIR
jgi:hypothetical protein